MNNIVVEKVYVKIIHRYLVLLKKIILIGRVQGMVIFNEI